MNTRRASWRAIGTNVEIVVNAGDVAAARAAVAGIIQSADSAFSRFRPGSELSQIQSRHAPARVSEMLGMAIDAGLRGAVLTDGLVDPTLGRVMRLIGYDVDFVTVARRTNGPPRFQVESVSGWRALEWDPHRRTANIPRGVELDFGSTGKALISDLAAPCRRTCRPGQRRAGGHRG